MGVDRYESVENEQGHKWQVVPTEELLHGLQRCVWSGMYSDDFGFTPPGDCKDCTLSTVGVANNKAQMGVLAPQRGKTGSNCHVECNPDPAPCKACTPAKPCQIDGPNASTDLSGCCLWEYNVECILDPTCRNVEFFFQYFTEYLDFSGTKNTDPSK